MARGHLFTFSIQIQCSNSIAILIREKIDQRNGLMKTHNRIMVNLVY